ncbi:MULTISPECIES: ABC1 kinase family protein [Prochlorococcus]|uniref:ABC1 atypical kinase-like domain-containing protein n=1 Tax=Prochlorococcus marinus (strain SARG / CCMP1375 / SS120) TaxID=167539 RepID=Q7VBH9_PROMA|nr:MULTISPECIES: AarF/UbiB family protein [Prochlorococcus]AAQ00158.1 Predicted protein kinase [Prochlorococcus marinus subsp. marinus str. CCMP1375]KGG19088.1 Ubiquinone biosynthesis monooxygenase UbiB [Prochlorococcus marinus str. SS2]
MTYKANRDFIWLILRPWIMIPRLIHIALTTIKLIIRFLIEGNNDDIEVQKDLAKYLLNTIADLGPCFIKLGQALSTRPDLVKQVWLDELTRLQDDLPPFDHHQALDIFHKEIGKTVYEIFEYFPDKSIASASLGQVYKARLNKNYWVAVKIQRPDLIFIIRRDLVIIRAISILLAPFLPLNLGFGLDEIIDEFGITLFKEIDYEKEADNAEKFASLFRNNKSVTVPRVERLLSARKVITTSWIEGTKIKNREVLISNGIDPTAIIRTAVTSGVQQLLEYGYFHADPHPGNLFAIKGNNGIYGNLGYVDFGMMDNLSDSDRITLTGAIVHLINKEYLLLATDFKKLGFLSENENINTLAPVLEEVLGSVINKDVNSLNLKTVTDKFSDLMFDYPFRVPSRFALIIRAVVSQEGLAIKLDPEFQILKFAYPYVAKRLLTDENEELIEILMDIIFDKNNNIRIDRLENLLGVVIDSSSNPSIELLPVAGNSIRMLTSSKGSEIRKKLLMSLVKDDELNTARIKEIIKLITRKLDPIDISSKFINKINPLHA